LGTRTSASFISRRRESDVDSVRDRDVNGEDPEDAEIISYRPILVGLCIESNVVAPGDSRKPPMGDEVDRLDL
jgi:hypothetical protein